MEVKLTDYGMKSDTEGYVTYIISDLDDASLDFLYNNLEGEKVRNDDSLNLTMFYIEKFYPFKSIEAQIKPDDFVAREEIEMKYFLSSFLEDM
jgi:hypothetical protein